MELVSVQKRLFLSALRLDSPHYVWVPGFASSASICGIACVTYFTMYVSAQSLDFLDLAKNSSFLVRELIGAIDGIRWN
jgi:hypothetical protein